MSTSTRSSDPISQHAPGAQGPARVGTLIIRLAAVALLLRGLSWLWAAEMQPGRDGDAASSALILGGLLCCIGIAALFVVARKAWQFELKRMKTLRLNAEQPWLWNSAWARNEIRAGEHGGGLILQWCFTGFWVVVTTGAAVHIFWESLQTGGKSGFLVLIFPVVSAFLLVSAIRTTLRWKKFGSSRFEMRSIPAPLGGELAGILHDRGVDGASNGFVARLSCLRQTVSGSEHRSVEEKVLWTERIEVPTLETGRGYDGTTVPIRFALPGDAPPSHALPSNDQNIWRLEVSAELPGEDYQVSFEVPVFRTQETDRLLPQSLVDRTTQEDLALRAHGAEIAIPPVRWWVTSFTMLFVAACLVFVAWVISSETESTGAVVFFAGFSAVVTIAALNAIGRSTRLEIRGAGIQIERLFFGFGPRLQIPAQEVGGVEIVYEMKFGKQKYFHIRLLPLVSPAEPSWMGTRGRKVTTSIAGEDEAEEIARVIRAVLNLEDPKGDIH